MPNETIYRGWLPVLSGYISFRNASGQMIAQRCRMPFVWGGLSHPDGLHVQQLRELKDELVPSASWNPFRNLLPASTGMFLFSMQTSWVDESENAICGLVYARPASPDSKCERGVNDVIPPMTGVVPETNGWILEFSVGRAGVIDLSWGNFNLEAALDIIDTEFTEVTAKEAAARLAFQTYLFLKDYIHSHKFHNGDDDSILIPYQITDNDDTTWYEKTARNLHASVVTSMRGGRFDVINAIGQISYLRTFLSLAKRNGASFPAINRKSLDVLLAGCEAKLERIKLVEAESTSLGGIILTLLFSFVAVLIAMLQLLQIPCIDIFAIKGGCSLFTVNPFAFQVADFVLGNWLWSVAGVYACVLIILFVFFRRSIHDIISQRIGHRRLDWIVLRPIFGSLLGDHGRIAASIWVILLSLIVLALLWTGIVASIR